MRLALHLGRTPHELSRSIGCDELEALLAYERLYGIPDGYFVAGLLAAVIVNCNTTKRRKTTPADFIPYFREGAASGMTVEELSAAFQAMAEAGKNGVSRDN